MGELLNFVFWVVVIGGIIISWKNRGEKTKQKAKTGLDRNADNEKNLELKLDQFSKEARDNLRWFIESDNEKIAAVRDEIGARAFNQSYESVAQKRADIARLGSMIDDPALAAAYIEHFEERGAPNRAKKKELKVDLREKLALLKEKLPLLFNAYDPSVMIEAEKVVSRAYSGSYESPAQKQSDIAWLEKMMGDKETASSIIECMEQARLLTA